MKSQKFNTKRVAVINSASAAVIVTRTPAENSIVIAGANANARLAADAWRRYL
jgi:hypothetical protein